MKKHLQVAMLMACAAFVVASCGPKSDLPGFKKTESGLYYKFDKVNNNARLVQMDDALTCCLTMWINNDTLFSNEGDPQRLLQAQESLFPGAIEEGLLMLHEGDDATFAVEADSLAQYFPMPDSYQPGTGAKMYYHIVLHQIVPAESLQDEMTSYTDQMEQMAQKEATALNEYISSHNVTTEPNADGLYIIIKKKGTGEKAQMGQTVLFNYTGRLLDGTMFDSNVEKDAKEGNIYDAQRTYAPASYVKGETYYVKGLMDALDQLPQGTSATVIMPSKLGYGATARTQKIPPFSALVFDITVVSIR